MDSSDCEDDDFDKLMQEIESEAREAAEAYFNDLYETAHGSTNPSADNGDGDALQNLDKDSLSPQGEAYSGQRIGNLKLKLAASPSGDFPVSHLSYYNENKWVLIEGREFSEVAILIHNAREDLQVLKRAISYYFLPATNPFGTIRSFISSKNYADAFKYVQHFVFEANRLDGTAESLSIISAGMLNEALDNSKTQGSAHAYNMLFFYLTFWLALCRQGLIPSEYSLDVDAALVDTASRRQDVLDSISAAFVGWKPYSEEELVSLLDYAYFWIDEAAPVIENIQEYLLSNPQVFSKNYAKPKPDVYFESVLGQKVRGVEIVGFRQSTSIMRYKTKAGDSREYCRINYTWRLMYQYAIDRVRNAVFILFCLMTGMRRRELAPLKFDDVTKGADGVWRVDFARYKTSNDPNYFGDADHISIPDYLGEAIEVYKRLRQFDSNFYKGYIFQPAVGSLELNRTNRMISKVARAAASETGVPQLHIHRFRKTIAELLIHETEANIDVVRMIFGHSSYAMTLRYVARNPFLVSSVVETLKEHFAEDFVDVVRAIHTGIYAGDAAHRIAEQVHKRPDLFGGTVLKTTIMQYVSHLFEGGSPLHIQRTSLGTICLSVAYQDGDKLPPCLSSKSGLIYPAKPDFSNCQIHCNNNIILQGSRHAIEHNIKFYRAILVNGARLKAEVVKELEQKISVNQRLLHELLGSDVKVESGSTKDNYKG